MPQKMPLLGMVVTSTKETHSLLISSWTCAWQTSLEPITSAVKMAALTANVVRTILILRFLLFCCWQRFHSLIDSQA